MADIVAATKRQSAGGKVPVATPNIGGGGSGMVSMETALAGAIGARYACFSHVPYSKSQCTSTNRSRCKYC